MSGVSSALGWLVARPIAHRGLHDPARGIIENTRAAALAAVEAGFAIECDVQATQDGEAVVFHDFELDRLTTASGPVRSRTMRELSVLPFRAGSDGMEPLGSYLEAIGGRVPLVIEIKSAFDGYLGLAQRVVEVAGQAQARGWPVALKSFDPRIVAALRVMAPDLPRGIVAMASYDPKDFPRPTDAERHAMANLLHFADTLPQFLSWHVKSLPSAAPHLCRVALSLPVMTWTVRSAADLELARRHADQIVFEGLDPSLVR